MVQVHKDLLFRI